MAGVRKVQLPKLPPGVTVHRSGSAVAPGGRVENSPGAMRPITPGRNILQYLREKYDGFVIQESLLRMQATLTNIASTYNFQILLTGQETSIEQKIDKNDLFATNKLGLFLAQQTIAKAGNTEMLTFPNNSLLDSTNVTVQDFYAIYNGTFFVQISTTVVYQALPMYKALNVPQTQKDTVNAAIAATSAWTSPTTGAGTYGPFENQRDKDYGFIELNNILELSGGAQNILQLNIPTFSGIKLATVTAGIQNILIVILDGFLIKNAAYRGL
jgi:hypothetical protein